MSYIGYSPEHSRAFTVDNFTGDGNTQTFTLSLPKPLSERGLLVVVNGVVQKPVFSYTLDSNSDIFFDEAPDIDAIITVTHLGRPVDLTVPRAGSIEGQHINGILYLPDDVYTGQGKDFYLRQDTTAPNTQQKVVWDRGNAVDVYLTYNPSTNQIESNVNIAGATVTSTVVDGFGEIAVQGQTTIESVNTPNIEFEGGNNITITTDAVTGKITFTATGGAGGGGASVLNDLTDVSTSSVQTGEVLKWSGTAWVNATDDTSSGGGTVTLQQVKAEALKAALIFG
tara:strand:+ start:653 stop:1501 length:849 start_codon:yes stop_codon:yes gene_type:complete